MPRRKYELKQRAERQAETRARIVAATAELHQEVGPAQTTVAEIARRAGVERATVYNHFPDEAALYGACQAHWLQRTPPPDPSVHAAIDDPQERLEAVLRDLYAWYRRGRRMTRNVLRDAELVPALARTLEARRAAMERTVALLLRGRNARSARRRRL